MFYSILPVDQEMDSEVKYEEIIYKGQLILAKTDKPGTLYTISIP